jgi:hypothetical protein
MLVVVVVVAVNELPSTVSEYVSELDQTYCDRKLRFDRDSFVSCPVRR